MRRWTRKKRQLSNRDTYPPSFFGCYAVFPELHWKWKFFSFWIFIFSLNVLNYVVFMFDYWLFFCWSSSLSLSLSFADPIRLLRVYYGMSMMLFLFIDNYDVTWMIWFRVTGKSRGKFCQDNLISFTKGFFVVMTECSASFGGCLDTRFVLKLLDILFNF